MTINKYFQFKYVNPDDFKFRWKTRKNLAFKSETLRLNRRVAKSAYDFKFYFPSIVDLNPDREYEYVSGTSDLKLGGLFQMFPLEDEFLIKIINKPTREVTFLIAGNVENEYLSEYMLQTLVFLFCNVDN